MLDISFKCWQSRECQFLKQTGLYCPWCGGTRAVKALLKGSFIESIYYHPIVIYILLIGLRGVLCRCISFWKPLKIEKIDYNAYIFIGFIIVMINWLVKNVMLYI